MASSQPCRIAQARKKADGDGTAPSSLSRGSALRLGKVACVEPTATAGFVPSPAIRKNIGVQMCYEVSRESYNFRIADLKIALI
jgi:hypothetical protein